MKYNVYVNGISNAELFFIISSVGFVVLWLLVAVLVYYLIRVVKMAEEILLKATVGTILNPPDEERFQ